MVFARSGQYVDHDVMCNLHSEIHDPTAIVTVTAAQARIFKKLPAHERVVLYARANGYKQREVGERLLIHQTTVYCREMRARERVKVLELMPDVYWEWSEEHDKLMMKILGDVMGLRAAMMARYYSQSHVAARLNTRQTNVRYAVTRALRDRNIKGRHDIHTMFKIMLDYPFVMMYSEITQTQEQISAQQKFLSELEQNCLSIDEMISEEDTELYATDEMSSSYCRSVTRSNLYMTYCKHHD